MPTAAIWPDPALVTVIGVAAGSLTTGCLIPQAVRTHRSRSTGDFSLVYFAAMDLGLGLWIVYGLCLGSVPIVVANVVSCALVTYLLALKLRHAGTASSGEADPQRGGPAGQRGSSARSPEQDAA